MLTLRFHWPLKPNRIDRLGTWLDYEGDKRGPHSSWIAVGPHLPAYSTDALTPRWIHLCYGQS